MYPRVKSLFSSHLLKTTFLKLNLIFHKVPESEHTEPSAKRDHDKKFVLSVAEELGVDELEVVNTTRIGHVKESGERLLKVEVKNVSSKKNILSKAKLLRQAKNETYHKIYITPDLSYQERSHQKSLRTELHRRRGEGEPNLCIRKGQIISFKSNPMNVVSHTLSAASVNNG